MSIHLFATRNIHKRTLSDTKKTRTLASSRFEAVCVNLLSSAVDRREVLGVAVGEWSDIVFLQCGTQVGLSVEHLARQGDKRNNAVVTVLLQGTFGDLT